MSPSQEPWQVRPGRARAASLPWRAQVGSARWIGSLAALTATSALSIDMSLPAQPTLGERFGVGSDQTQLTLSLYLLGYALGQLVMGYVSDALGRRRVLLWGLGIYTVAGLACTVTPGLWFLVSMRFVQGTGAAAGTVIARAMVRDTHAGSEAARMMATMVAVLALAPMLAPLVGAFLLEHLGWRAIFGCLFVCGLVWSAMTAASLDETLGARKPLTFVDLRIGVVQFFRAKGTRIPALLVALSFGAQFAFISGSPFVLIQGYGMQPSRFGFYFASAAIALMGGSASGARLLKRGRTPVQVLRLGSLAQMTAAAAMVLLVRWPETGVMGPMGPMLLSFVGIGFVSPNAMAIAMEPVPEIAGTASAILGALQMTAGALSGYVVASIGGASPVALAWQVAILSSACALLGPLGLGALKPRRAAA